MRYILPFFIFPVLLFGQDFDQTKVDSIKNIISTTTDDSILVFNYKALSDQFFYYSSDSIIYYTDKIHDIAVRTKNEKYKYMAYYDYGTAFWEKSQYIKAVGYYSEALKFYQGINTSKADTIKADISYNLGLCYSDMSNYDKGLEYLNAALQYFDNYKNLQWKAHSYNAIGDIYVELENYDKAIEIYNLALETLPIKHKGKFDQGLIFGNLADCYFKMGEIDTSRTLVKKSIEIYEQEDMKWGMAFCYGVLSKISMQDKEYEQAKTYANISLDYSQEQGAIAEVAEAYLLMGKAGLLNNELDYALRNTQEGINIKQYAELKDSLFSLDKIEELNQVNIKAETAQRDAEIANQNLKIANQSITRNYLIGSIGAITLLFLFFLNRSRLKQELTNKEVLLREEKIENLEQKQKLLVVDYIIQGQEEERKRVAKDLHDGLGGILSTAKHQLSNVRKKHMDLDSSEVFLKAEALLASAHGEVRKIAHNMMPDALSTLGLQAATEDLANQVNLTDKLQVKTQIQLGQDTLSPNQELLLYRVIQESINNAFKHAGAENMLIQLIDQGEELHLAIEDDGKGFHISDTQKRNGIGLRSMESRVKYLNGNFDITSKLGEGTSIDVIIPTTV